MVSNNYSNQNFFVSSTSLSKLTYEIGSTKIKEKLSKPSFYEIISKMWKCLYIFFDFL